MSKILILGASGYVGQATVNALQDPKYSKFEISAGVRNPADAKNASLKTGKVQLVACDMSDPASLAGPLKGKDAVYIITPGTEKRGEIAMGAVDACKAAKVPFVVVVSVLNALDSSTIFGRQFQPLEKHVQLSGLNYCLLRLPVFLDNQWGNAETIKGMDKFFSPTGANGFYTPVTVQDIGACSAVILTEGAAKHANRIYHLTMPSTTDDEIAAAFSKALGRKIEHVQVPPEAAKKAMMDKGFPEWQVDGILELYKSFNESNGFTNLYNGDIERLTGKQPTTAEQWMSQVKGGFSK